MNKGRIAKMLLVAGIMAMPGPAAANHGDPMYRYKFYSDATYTQQVGEDQGYCAFFGVGYTHSGQSTNYYTADLIAYCANDGHGWYEEPI